jgi:hypothetical protein
MSRAVNDHQPDPTETETQPPSSPDRFEGADLGNYLGNFAPPSKPLQASPSPPPRDEEYQHYPQELQEQEAQEDAIMAMYNRHLQATHKALSESSIVVGACWRQIQVKHERCLFDSAMLVRREKELLKEVKIIGKKIQEVADQK